MAYPKATPKLRWGRLNWKSVSDTATKKLLALSDLAGEGRAIQTHSKKRLAPQKTALLKYKFTAFYLA